jgi:hypothetical protein
MNILDGSYRKGNVPCETCFRLLEKGVSPQPMSKCIPCHLIFDIKMDFTRKARFVAGGHVTDPPSSLTYSSVVSRDSVRLVFLVAALMILKFWLLISGRLILMPT